MKQFEGPTMIPVEGQNMEMTTWNSRLAPVEKKVRNVTINFGPQHPAAHGVLRLVLELDGEVGCSFMVWAAQFVGFYRQKDHCCQCLTKLISLQLLYFESIFLTL